MAIKASGTITLASVVDVDSITPYYLLQTATLSPPAKPTSNPPPSSWVTSEPQFDYSKKLYTTMLVVYSNGTWEYSDVSLVSEYEAAKSAYNIAQNTQDQVTAVNNYFWFNETGTDVGAHITEVPKEEWDDSTSPNYHKGGNVAVRSNEIAIRNGLNDIASFGSSGISMKDPSQHEVFSVNVKSGNITHILRYGYKSSDGYGGVINLGRTINTFTSISVTFYGINETPADAETLTFYSLPVAEHMSDTGEYGFYVDQINSSTLEIVFYGEDADGFSALIVDNFTIKYSTNQITTEMDLGAFPDKTLAAPMRIGNGNASNNVSNAFAIDWAGNGLFAGDDIRYGCNPDSSGGKSLIHGEMYNGYYLSSSSGMYMFDVYQMGKLVTVLCMCNKTGSTPAGNNIFTGIVNGSWGRIPAPAMDYATGAGFYNTCTIGGFLYMDGDDLRITIRNLGSTTLAAGAVTYVSFTYMTNE